MLSTCTVCRKLYTSTCCLAGFAGTALLMLPCIGASCSDAPTGRREVTPSSFEKVLTCETAQNLLRRFAVLFGACAALGDASDCLDMSSNPEYDDSYESKLMSSDSFIQRCCKECGLPPGWSKTRRITTAVSGESDTLGQAAHADATLYVQHAKEYNPTGLYADYWEWAHALNMSCPDCIVV